MVVGRPLNLNFFANVFGESKYISKFFIFKSSKKVKDFKKFNQEFDLALIDLVYYRTILNEVENSVDLDTSIKDYKISKDYRNNNLVMGYYMNAEKRVIFYLELSLIHI